MFCPEISVLAKKHWTLEMSIRSASKYLVIVAADRAGNGPTVQF